MRTTWLKGLVFAWLIPACGGPRELSRKEAMIPVLPDDRNLATIALRSACTELGTFYGAPASGDTSLRTELKILTGNHSPCPPKLATADDIRRCAGEHQAQVVQIIGAETETIDDSPLIGALREANLFSASVSSKIGSSSGVVNAHANQLRLDDWATNAVQTRTLSLDLRFWRCPASRALPAKGELVWKREGVSKLDLFQDGTRVGGAAEYDKLPEIVAAHPKALDFAKDSLSHQGAGYTKVYVGLPIALLALAADAVAVVGLVKSNDMLAYGGLAGGIVLTSVAVPIMLSGGTSFQRAQTSAMNAVDAWNDDYVHAKGEATTQPGDLKPISPATADVQPVSRSEP